MRIGTLPRRFGLVRVGGQLLTMDPDFFIAVMQEIIVIDARADFAGDYNEYLAYHESFDVVPEGAVVRVYEAEYDRETERVTFR